MFGYLDFLSLKLFGYIDRGPHLGLEDGKPPRCSGWPFSVYTSRSFLTSFACQRRRWTDSCSVVPVLVSLLLLLRRCGGVALPFVCLCFRSTSARF